MPTYYHPNAVRDTVDDVDGAVTLGGETLDIADDGTLECSESQASTLARMYDVDLSDLETGSDICGTELSDGGTCERPAGECPYHGD